MPDISYGVKVITEERERQTQEEGWTAEHDDQWIIGELASAAACYALPERLRQTARRILSEGDTPLNWPWAAKWWKPSPENRKKELIKAGALIAAELDRLDRLDRLDTLK